MSRAGTRRLWRCRVYAYIVLLLTGFALFLAWRQLPDQMGSVQSFRGRTKQRPTAGSEYFDVGASLDKVSLQQVTLVHAERSFPKQKDGTPTTNATAGKAAKASAGPVGPLNARMLNISNHARTTIPSAKKLTAPKVPPRPAFTPEELAEREALRKNSTKALFGLNLCPNCVSRGADMEEEAAFFEKYGALEAGRQRCLRDIREHIIEDFRPLMTNVNRIVLMDVTLHTNMGDSVLWRAAVHLASLFGHSINHVCSGSQGARNLYSTIHQFPSCDLKKIISLVQDNGLVLYQAGGNWGNLYRFVQQYRMRALQVLAYNFQREESNFSVVQLPQTIHYRVQDDVSMDVDDYLLHSLPPNFFTLFTRQKDSFEFAQKHYGDNVEKKLTADLAFALGDLVPAEPEVDILVLMRSDGEITHEDGVEKTKLHAFLKASNMTYIYRDWQYRPTLAEFSNSNPTVMSEVRLSAAVKIISLGRVVITNRMHGSVMATLVGRTLLWVDTKQKKLSGTRNTAFSMSPFCTDQNLRSFKFPTILSAAEAAVEYLSQTPNLETFT